MDITTILGLGLAWAALLIAVVLEGGNFASLVNTPAFVLVVFGTLGAGITGASMKTVTSIPAIVRSAIKNSSMDTVAIIKTMVDFARKARREDRKSVV